MNYIYDIYLNFNDNLYDFYDWNHDDNLEHIRKIAIFRVNTDLLKTIENNKIRFKNIDFLENTCELFINKSVKKLSFAFVLTDGMEVIAVKLNNKGITYSFSKFLLEEEEEVLDLVPTLTNTNFDIEIIKQNKIDFLLTRNDIKKKEYILNNLNQIKNETDKLSYLYYECFNKKNGSLDQMYVDLYKEVNNNFSRCSNIIYDFFKLTSINK